MRTYGRGEGDEIDRPTAVGGAAPSTMGVPVHDVQPTCLVRERRRPGYLNDFVV